MRLVVSIDDLTDLIGKQLIAKLPPGDLTKTNKAIAFKRGGHYCFLKHHQILSNYLADFIQENLMKKEAGRISALGDEVETTEKLEKKQLKI